jgi:hypothetical protein
MYRFVYCFSFFFLFDEFIFLLGFGFWLIDMVGVFFVGAHALLLKGWLVGPSLG